MKQQDIKQVTEYAERLAALCDELAGFSETLAVGPDKTAIIDVWEKMGEPLETLRYISRYGSITAEPPAATVKRPHVEALEDDTAACNTDCPLYSKGYCGYLDSRRMTFSPSLWGLKDKTDCPRYREIYPDRVGRK